MTKPNSPAAFAQAVLGVVAKALASDTALDTIKTDIDALVKDYTGRMPQLVFKVAESRRMVYGWANVVTKDGADVEDLQGDVMEMDNLREVVHDYIRAERVGKAMHDGPQIGEVLDSFVFDSEVQAALGVNFGCEGWLVGFHVKDDAVWKRVEAGELRAFSIGGSGDRTPIPS